VGAGAEGVEAGAAGGAVGAGGSGFLPHPTKTAAIADTEAHCNKLRFDKLDKLGKLFIYKSKNQNK
jgi:hypothetical protein